MIVESGLADEVRALVRGMSGGRPDVPISVTRGPARDTNEPSSQTTQMTSQKEDKPLDPVSPGDDRSHR
jgi:hypothetical protein